MPCFGLGLILIATGQSPAMTQRQRPLSDLLSQRLSGVTRGRVRANSPRSTPFGNGDHCARPPANPEPQTAACRAHHPLGECLRHDLHDPQRVADLQCLADLSVQFPAVGHARRLARRRHCLALRGHVAPGRQRLVLPDLRSARRLFTP